MQIFAKTLNIVRQKTPFSALASLKTASFTPVKSTVLSFGSFGNGVYSLDTPTLWTDSKHGLPIFSFCKNLTT